MIVHQSRAKFKILDWGRRSGKGVLAVFELLYVIQYLIDLVRPAIMVPHHRLWIVGPSYPQLDQAWEEVDHYLKLVPHLETRPPLVDEKTRFLVGDGRLQFKSADNPNSLQNVALDWVWVTEAQDIPDKVWRQKITPMLHSPGVLGWAIIEGHAPEPDTWFESLYKLGQDPNHPEYESWQMFTPENPHIDWDAIVKESEDIPEEDFRREYFCEVPQSFGKAFNRESIDMCTGGELEEPIDGVGYVLGVDLGKQIDPTVIIAMRKSQKRVVGFERLMKTDWTVQEDVITTMHEKWNKAPVYIDSTGVGAPIVDSLKKNGVIAKPINMTKEKVDLINKLAAAIEHGNIRFPNITVLIKELKGMRRISKDSQGRDLKIQRLSAPAGHHDDCPIALALAYHGCRYSGDYVAAKPRDLRRSI